MEQYTTKKSIILYINISIGILHGLNKLGIVNFVPDSYYFIIPISLLSTFLIWNSPLIFDKNK